MVTGEAAWEGYGRAPPAAGRRSWGVGVWCGRNPRERMRKGGKRESEEGLGWMEWGGQIGLKLLQFENLGFSWALRSI